MRTIVIIWAVLAALAMAHFGMFQNNHMYGRIHSDAQGYYGYLIAVFIEDIHDWDRVIDSYSDTYFEGKAENFTVSSEHGLINKYYVGTAILIFPFFMLSYWFAAATGVPVDGYSLPFQNGILVCGLFYAGLGMYVLSGFLESKGIERWIAVFASVCCLFATNLLHYTISEPAMSHVYSFALFSIFLYTADRFLKTGSGWNWYLCAIILALIILVRPVNGLVIFSVPFIAGELEQIIQRIKETTISRWIIAGVVFMSILSIQFYMYYAQVGRLFVWSYKNEGFDFLDPEIINVLFSYKKGFFIYTPIAILGVIGMVVAVVKRKTEGTWLLIFLALSVYVISCWWNWYYGDSFGMRALIEFLPFVAFGLAVLIQAVSRWKRIKELLLTACLLLVFVNLVQSYQYQKFILHWDDMTEASYWQVFLKTEPKYEGILYQELPEKEQIIFDMAFASDFESESEWGNEGINTERAASGQKSTRVTTENPFGSTLTVPVSRLGPAGRKRLIITAKVWAEQRYASLNFAYSYREDNGDYGHQYIGIGHHISEPHQWVEIQHTVVMDEPKTDNDLWIIYPYLSPKDQTHADESDLINVYLDDVRYEIQTLNY